MDSSPSRRPPSIIYNEGGGCAVRTSE